jgi:hypothetical protein
MQPPAQTQVPGSRAGTRGREKRGGAFSRRGHLVVRVGRGRRLGSRSSIGRGQNEGSAEALDHPARGVPIAGVYGWEQIPDLFRAYAALGMEGIVLDDLEGRYSPGKRSDAWPKVKCQTWQAHRERRLPWASRSPNG